jgi:membrane protein DedA with SNARE-associated domain
METLVTHIFDFVRLHGEWAAPIVFVLAFCESLAFISLLVPATVLLWGIGALIGASGLDFWPIWLAAALGGGFGDWLSYWLGYHFHRQIAQSWPLSRHPTLIPRAHALFEKWGAPGVFIGRFFGPLRAVVPLVAGASRMSPLPFQLANWLSAVVWATTTLAPGAFGVSWLKDWWH